MAETIEARLQKMGVTLPKPAASVANYVPFVVSGNQVFISGQLPFRSDGSFQTGKVGSEVALEKAVEAARFCAINILAQAAQACGSADRIGRIVRLGAFVQSADDFHDQPKVANGASDFLVELFGDRGRHCRSAVGVNALPLNASVEIDAIVEIAPDLGGQI